MENKKNLFIITSALHTVGADVNLLNNRIYQTISTVNSIKSNVKDPEIWILDASHVKLDNSVYDLFPKDVNFFKVNEFYEKDIKRIKIQTDVIVKHLKSLFNTKDGTTEIEGVLFNAYIKSKTEAFMINKFFQSIDQNDLINFNRIYKISGRYLISNKFDQKLYDESKGSCVFKKRVKASPHIKDPYFQYNCTLWSFDAVLFNQIKNTIFQMETWIDDSFIKQQQPVDLEHAFFKFMNLNNIPVKELHTMGVMGLVNNESKSFFIG